ncbi:hypothetical protein GCM10027290_39870 [Micromonospora sonneratiae]|uniref:Sugar ABC transporter permease n=1 Tax=Micromonospora sonneratiae TaxID=1184706 RepID=A0ABW3YEL6_9ACTN
MTTTPLPQPEPAFIPPSTMERPSAVPRPGLGRGAQIGLGLALLAPALIALLWSYVIPSVSTLLKSFQKDNLIGPPKSVGTANYEQFAEIGLGSFGFGLLLGLVPLLVVLVVAPLLAFVADRAGRVGRLVTRGLLAAPLACYAPTALATAWRAYRLEPGAWMESPYASTLSMAAAMSFGLVVAVAGTLFLSAVRRRPAGGGGRGLALLAVGATLGLGVVAAALQSSTLQFTITGAGTERELATPTFLVMQHGFRMLNIGLAAAGSTVLLVLLALLGLVAVGLLILTRTRIEFDGWRDRPAPSTEAAAVQPAETASQPAGVPVAQPTGMVAVGRRSNPVALVLLALGLVVFLAVVGYALWPWLRSFFGDTAPLPDRFSTGSVLVNTWGPTLISAVVSVGIAALGGFAIGGLRPLGRFSEALLLLFAPWFFVGSGPLLIANYLRARDLDQINTFIGLIPPSWVSIPALVAFTLLFRGQQARWRAGSGFVSSMLLPALPMLGLAGLLTWLLAAQDLIWPYAVAQAAEMLPAPVVLLLTGGTSAFRGGAASEAIGLALPIPMVLLLLAAFAALQVFYLDRLAIRAGRSEQRA